MWTLAKAILPSREIWPRASGANGLSTRSTCGPLPTAASVCSIFAFVAASLTSAAAKTTWFVSVDSVLKLALSRFRAVVDSVPGRENESVYPDPALALTPASSTSAATQAPRTTSFRSKHHRARPFMRQPYGHRPEGGGFPQPPRCLLGVTDVESRHDLQGATDHRERVPATSTGAPAPTPHAARSAEQPSITRMGSCQSPVRWWIAPTATGPAAASV